MWRQVVPLVRPLASRWSPVVFQREILSIPFLFISLPDFFSHNEGGVHPPPPIKGRLGPTRSGRFDSTRAFFSVHGSPVTEHGTLIPLPARAVISRHSVVIFVLSLYRSLYRSLHRRFMAGDCASAYSYARKSGVSSLFWQAL
jgi:hypothetical protein